MRFLKYISALLPLFLIPTNNTMAADQNGYTAQYECRAGAQYCNVDVAVLVSQPCEQTILPTTAPLNNWSAIDWTKNVICVAAGNHTARGLLTLGGSGSGGQHKVLRYYRAEDDGSDPWNQAPADRARVTGLRTSGQSFWLIDRLSFDERVTTPHIITEGSSQHVVFNRILTENLDPVSGDDPSIYLASGEYIWVQNSVVRNCVARPGRTGHGIDIGSRNQRVVTNEIYNCGKQVAGLFGSDTSGLVVESNDIYINDYTDCRGGDSPSGSCGKARNLVNINTKASSSNPMQYIQNRIWGMRPCDTGVACSFGGGNYAVTGGYDDGVSWVVLKNNVIFDSSGGIMRVVGPNSYSNNQTTVGNILYNIKSYNGVRNTCVGWYSAGGRQTGHGVYLNTVIDCRPGTGWAEWGNVQDSDVRCNVVLSSDAATGSAGSGTEIDNNAYYDTTPSDNSTINGSVRTRADVTDYRVGDIIRTSPVSSCTTAGDSACFLYVVTTGGKSGNGSPNYCTELGCAVTDGDITVRAIRGPYVFKRKLKTTANGESVVIPYARIHSSAQEALACPATAGTRPGIGVGSLF